MGALATTHHCTQSVVHAHLVVEVVETCADIVAVFGWIIHLADEYHIGIAHVQGVGGPLPKGSWYHLSHIATESVDPL